MSKRPKARPAKKRAAAKSTAVATTAPPKRSTHPVDAELVRDLAKILDDTGLSEIEVERGELRLRLARTPMFAQPPSQAHVIHSAPAPVALPPPAAAPAPPPAAAAPAPAADAASHPGAVLSPMVGTAYLSPEPGAPPFVKVGDTVTAGQTIMVVEAMKTFNPIPAPRAGKVTAIIVSDSQPVEFNEPLLILE